MPERLRLRFRHGCSPPRRLHGVAAVLVLLALAAAPVAAARRASGDAVVLTGLVTDGRGQPLPEIAVVLEMSRTGLDLARLSRRQQAVERLRATTNAAGEYTLQWRWSDYYNHFQLAAAVPVRKPGGEKLEELARVDVSRRLAQGSGDAPVVAALTVADTTFLDALRAFVAAISTDDERSVYHDMGKPDTLDTVAYPGHREASWWYFEAGKVYRFRDGRLLQVAAFDPIRGF
jgi:hypothetical protein